MVENAPRTTALIASIYPQGNVPSIIHQLMEAAAAGEVLNHKIVSGLNNEVTPQEVEEYFYALANGIKYALEKYGYSPKDLHLARKKLTVTTASGGKNATILYNQDDDGLYVNLASMAENIIKARDPLNGFTNEHIVAHLPNQYMDLSAFVTMLGIEEGYHSYQSKDPAKNADLERKRKQVGFDADQLPETAEGQINHSARIKQDPYETETTLIIGDALVDFGIIEKNTLRQRS